MFSLFSFFAPHSLFVLQGKCAKKILLCHVWQAGSFGGFLHYDKWFCTTFEALYTIVPMIPQAAGLCGSWRIDLLAPKYEVLQSNSCLDAKGLWKPGQSFILAGFTLSLPCSALCRTGYTIIDTSCNPSLLHNCADHPADCNLFDIQPLTSIYIIKIYETVKGSPMRQPV